MQTNGKIAVEGEGRSTELDTCYRIFEKLEAQRAETLAEASAWPAHGLSFRPTPGSWSVTEVVDHIVRAESGTIAAVRAGLLNPHVLGTEDRPKVAALDAALRSEQSFKVPAEAKDIYPDSQTTFPQVARRWQESRAELGQLVRELPSKDAQYGVFYHPFAGWMTLAEVLDHFSAHLYHHSLQLARLRESFKASQA